METGKAVLYIGAAIGALVALAWLFVRLDRKEKNKAYDERQQLMKGRASEFSLMVSALYFVVLSLVCYAFPDGLGKLEPWLLIGAGVMAQLTAYHSYCLLTDAALPLSGSHGMTAVYYGGLALLQWGYYSNRQRFTDMESAREISLAWMYLIGSMCFGFLALCHVLSALRKKKE